MALSDKITITSDFKSIKQVEKISTKEFIDLAQQVQQIMQEEAKIARDSEETGSLFPYPV